MSRLPDTHKYHASSLKGSCLRPLYFRHAYPEATDPPGSLNALGGTLGHYLMTKMHEGKEEWCASAKYYADKIKSIVNEQKDALLDSSVCMKLDTTGRGTWLDVDGA